VLGVLRHPVFWGVTLVGFLAISGLLLRPFGAPAGLPPPSTGRLVVATPTVAPAVAIPTADPTAAATPLASASPTPAPALQSTSGSSAIISVEPRATAPVTLDQLDKRASPTATAPAGSGVPILMYHYIRVNPVPTDRIGFGLSVTPADFAAQMRYLSEHGFHAVTVAQVREHVLHNAPLPDHPVAITFDDGYDDAYTVARPILEEYHFTATFFIITGFVGQPRYMTWSQIIALDHEHYEIGSHTEHHVGLPNVSAPTRQLELAGSRAALEAHLGHPVVDFCYPSGEVNPTTELAVTQAGYLAATTTAPGWARPGDDPLRLPRVRIGGGMTLLQYAAVLGRPPLLVAASAPRIAPTPIPLRATATPRRVTSATPTPR